MLNHVPPFKLATAEFSIRVYELCFMSMKFSDSASMAKIAIARGDEDLRTWFEAEGKIPENWEMFKSKMHEYAEQKAVRDSAEQRQRKRKPTRCVVKRAVPFAESARDFMDIREVLYNKACEVQARATKEKHRNEQQKSKLLKVDLGRECPTELQEEKGKALIKQTNKTCDMHKEMGKAHKMHKANNAREKMNEAYRKHLLLQEEMHQALNKQEALRKQKMQEREEKLQKMLVDSVKKQEEKKLKKLKRQHELKKQHDDAEMAAAQEELVVLKELPQEMNLIQVEQEAPNNKEADGRCESANRSPVETKFENAQVEEFLLTKRRPEPDEVNEFGRKIRKKLKSEELKIFKDGKNNQDYRRRKKGRLWMQRESLIDGHEVVERQLDSSKKKTGRPRMKKAFKVYWQEGSPIREPVIVDGQEILAHVKLKRAMKYWLRSGCVI